MSASSYSYSNLQTFRSCPRLFGFHKLGYEPVAVSEPLTTGQLVHAGLAAHFKGRDATKEINEQAAQSMRRITEHSSDRYNDEVALSKAEGRALALVRRYISGWAKDYRAVFVEPGLKLDGVICHPDLIAYYQEQRVIVDFKTSYHPDSRWYDISGQVDLYAYVVGKLERQGHPDCVSLVIYDIISEEGIFRHMRPPRLEAGEKLFTKIKALAEVASGNTPFLLEDPHPDYTCPTRCDFFRACWLLETGSWEDCRDYLEGNFIHVV